MKQLNILRFLFITLLFFSCTKEKAPFPDFTSEDLKLIPYAGNDTLVFVDSLGESITLIGSDRENYFEDLTSDKPNSFYRTNTINFTEASSVYPKQYWRFQLKQYSPSNFESMLEAFSFVPFEITTDMDTISVEKFFVQIENSQFTFDSSPDLLMSVGQKLNSVVLGNKTYFNVYAIHEAPDDILLPAAFQHHHDLLLCGKRHHRFSTA